MPTQKKTDTKKTDSKKTSVVVKETKKTTGTKKPGAGTQTITADFQTPDLKTIVLNAMDELKAQDVVCLDISQLSSFTDLMVIATGSSNRHVKSIAENVAVKAKQSGFQPIGVEGIETGEWILVDLGDIVVNVMLANTRTFYDLEKLWTELASAQKTTASQKPTTNQKSTTKQKSTTAQRTTAQVTPGLKTSAKKKVTAKEIDSKTKKTTHVKSKSPQKTSSSKKTVSAKKTLSKKSSPKKASAKQSTTARRTVRPKSNGSTTKSIR